MSRPIFAVLAIASLMGCERPTTEAQPPGLPLHDTSMPPGVSKLKSGLAYIFLERGSGTRSPLPTDTVEMNFSAWTADGKLFDSTHGNPTTRNLETLVKGWSQSLQLMKEGDVARFWIPSHLAHNAPTGRLMLEVRLIAIK